MPIIIAIVAFIFYLIIIIFGSAFFIMCMAYGYWWLSIGMALVLWLLMFIGSTVGLVCALKNAFKALKAVKTEKRE